MKYLLFFFLFVSFYFITWDSKVRAQSEYVLPYPAAMPGSIFYKADLIYEIIQKYWYYGEFGQIKYNLKLADKYLVESKTLFEYKQYLLGIQALKKSDYYFLQLSNNLVQATANNKNISSKSELIKSASVKHIEFLNIILNNLPVDFNWKPENKPTVYLQLHESVRKSIKIREKL